MGTTTKMTWDQVAVGSGVKWQNRDYTIPSERVDGDGLILRHVVPDQPVEGEHDNGEFDVAGYPDDPVGIDVRPPGADCEAIDADSAHKARVGSTR